MSVFSYPARFVVAFVLVLFVLLTQSGCASIPEEKIVYKTRTVYVAVPDSLTAVITPKKPVAKDVYLGWLPQEKEVYLSELVKDLYKDINTCNKNMSSIRQIQNKTKEVIDESPPRH